MIGRRGVLGFALAVPLALAGCGWEPLYADRAAGPADAELQAIRVEPILDRVGQQLELALRESLKPTGAPVPTRYALRTQLTVVRQDLGIQTQGYGTRGKLDIAASFELVDIARGVSLLNSGVHVADAFDIVANEYASLVAEEDARKRLVEEMRREIVTRLTLYMQRRVTG
jgi:LPS-assembly lipoprotein